MGYGDRSLTISSRGWSLRIACAFLSLLVLIASSGWIIAPLSMTIHNPPDLRTGSTRP